MVKITLIALFYLTKNKHSFLVFEKLEKLGLGDSSKHPQILMYVYIYIDCKVKVVFSRLFFSILVKLVSYSPLSAPVSILLSTYRVAGVGGVL